MGLLSEHSRGRGQSPRTRVTPREPATRPMRYRIERAFGGGCYRPLGDWGGVVSVTEAWTKLVTRSREPEWTFNVGHQRFRMVDEQGRVIERLEVGA